jgi:Patatin phospholipase
VRQVFNIVHLISQHKNYEGHARDYEFSGTSMREHLDSGYEDTLRTLRHPEWLERPAIARRDDPRSAPRRSDIGAAGGPARALYQIQNLWPPTQFPIG